MKKINELVSLEVIVPTDLVNLTSEEIVDLGNLNQEELKELYNSKIEEKFYLVNDLSVPYIVRIAVAEKNKVVSLEPELVDECDVVELTESIQEILQENSIPVYKSEFDVDGIKEAHKRKKEINETVESIKEKSKEKFNEIIDKAKEEGSITKVINDDKIKGEVEPEIEENAIKKIKEVITDIAEVKEDGTIIYKSDLKVKDKINIIDAEVLNETD